MSTKRHVMYKKVEKQIVNPPKGIKEVSLAEAETLGHLMYRAYRGTIDYEGETLEQSIQEMQEVLAGKYGKVNLPASLVVMDNARAVSAVIFVDFPKEKMPLLAFTMTDPEFQGKGYSQSLIKLSLNKLLEQDFEECCLVVTDGNEPAQSIYKKLGFTPK